VSASTLESAAKCPFRFFLQHGLGVWPLEETEPDAEAWLTPLMKGSELHALFARILRDVRDQSRAPDLKKDGRRLHAWGEARLEALRAEMPPPSDEVFAREARAFLDDLDAFLAAECDGRHGRHPVGFEVTFGMPLDEGDTEPLASVEPLVIGLGGTRRLVVRGRIDRINRDGPGRYEVVDYKTGGYYADDWTGTFAGGTRLQHALYGRAAEGLLAAAGKKKAEVVRGIYVFPAVKGHRRRKVIDAADTTTLPAVLRDLVDVIGTGAFAIADGKGKCRFCEFAAACHADDPAGPDDDVTRAARKIENAANTVLDPYRRLRRHE
jgi:hypothetical protein